MLQYDLMTDSEKATMLAESKLKSQLPKIIKTGYEGLFLVHYFTAGEDEVQI